MHRYSWIGIAALVVWNLGCSCNPDKSAEVQAPTAQAVAADAAKDAKPEDANPEATKKDAEVKAFEVKDREIKSEENQIIINVHYPSFGHAAIDEAIEKKLTKAIDEAKVSLTEARQDEVHPEIMYSYNTNYEVFRATPEGVDVLMKHSQYMGGAHDSMALEVMMLDGEGKDIDPLTLLGDVDAALPKLSEEARKQLRAQLSEFDDIDSMIEEGTKPTRENFSKIVRTENGLRIYFEPYQVAPWAAGILYFDYKLDQ